MKRSLSSLASCVHTLLRSEDIGIGSLTVITV